MFFLIILHFIFLIFKKKQHAMTPSYRNRTCFHLIIHSQHIMCGFAISYTLAIVLFARCIWDIIEGVKCISMDL